MRLRRCEVLREQLCSSRERILGCQPGEGRECRLMGAGFTFGDQTEGMSVR